MAFADLTDVRCYYEIRGEGDPLLLIPGLGCTSASWDPILPELARHFSVILFDNRGMGRSVARRQVRNLKHAAADIVELLDELQLDSAHVLGLSLGGIIAQRLTMDHPSRVDRLVLISCTDTFSPYLRQVALLLAHSLRKFPSETFVRTVELLTTAPLFFDTHTEQVEEQVRRKSQCGFSRKALAHQLRALACSDRDKHDPIITTPTLVLAGEHDALIPNCYARQMADRIPGSEFHLIEGAGHNPFDECPERAIPRVLEFLSRGRGTDFAYQSSDEHELIEAGG
jgi:pimeloyl-ACP methyl ester carboxylesterase